MTRQVEQGTFHRWCRRCGWKGTYTTAGKGDFAKRQHSCEKWAEKLAGQKRRVERLAAVDRTPKPCLHKRASHEHGTRAAYVLDCCRCYPCAKANAEAENTRERQKAYGRYDKYVDAQPIREHLAELRDYGIGLKRVAALTGVSTGTLTKIVYGLYAPGPGGCTGNGVKLREPSKRVLRTTAEKLLAVKAAPENLGTGQVDHERSPQARLHLRALVALGWSQSKLAARLGILRSNFTPITAGTREMSRTTVDKVEALYDELSMTLPPETNQRERIAASRARNYAKARGWLPPLALEDVDDFAPDGPALDEQAIWRRMHGDKTVRLTRAEGQELRRRWYEAGRSGAELERICGMAPTTRTTDRQEAS